jgi:hypothetical protein
MVDATERDTHDTMQTIEATAADNAGESTSLLATEESGRRAGRDEEEYLKDFQELPWHHRPTVSYASCKAPAAQIRVCRVITKLMGIEYRQVFWLLPPFCLFAIAFGGFVASCHVEQFRF